MQQSSNHHQVFIVISLTDHEAENILVSLLDIYVAYFENFLLIPIVYIFLRVFDTL